MFYILHGEEEFSRSEELAGLRAQLGAGDPAMAQLNTTVFDGKNLTMGELRHACDSVPFLYDRRLVVVHGLLSWLVPEKSGKGSRPQKGHSSAARRAFLEELAAYLPLLPDTTRLVFTEDETLKASHPILKLAQEQHKTGKAHVKEYKQPQEGNLANWIQERAREGNGQIGWDAARKIIELAGNDLRLLDLEIDKLLVYADGRPVTEADVLALASRAREENIFDLVDCVGRREADEALRLLHHFLDEGQAPLGLLGMMARQIRILIQVSELRDEAKGQSEIAKRLKLHPFVVKKGAAQALNFSMEQLEQAHALVLNTDWKIKTGEMEDVLALDLLVVALTRL